MLMLKCHRQSGYVLIITLIFVFIFSVLVVSQTDLLIVTMRSDTAIKQYHALFYRAESGVLSMEAHLLGKNISLPSSPITLETHLEHIKIDGCGNKTLDIVAIATWHVRHFVLRAHEIFASVPTVKNCRKMRPRKRLWWEES